MYPFRTLPEPIDSVACEWCGHPVWDHYTGERCVECDRSESSSACGRFSLYAFSEAAIAAIEERTFLH